MNVTNTCGNCKFFKERLDPTTKELSKFGKCMKDATWDKSIAKPYWRRCGLLPTKEFGCILFEPKQ